MNTSQLILHSENALHPPLRALVFFLFGVLAVLNGAATPIAPSELAAPKIERVAGTLYFRVQPSVAGRRYQLQYSDTMGVGSWLNIGEVAIGNGSNLEMTTPFTAAVSKRFFRLALDGVVVVPEGFSLIPASSFIMGDSDSASPDPLAPRVTVTASAFYIEKHEVTKALWDNVRIWGATNGYTDLRTGGGKGSDHPVQTVSWYDAVKWCNARSQKDGLAPVYTVSGAVMKIGVAEPIANWSANGYRLPTEAEWEKAARGGVSGRRFPSGSNAINHNQANYRATPLYSYDLSGAVNNYHPIYATGLTPYTSPVGSFPFNGYELNEMAGNVSEWCWDWYGDSTYQNNSSDPRGPTSGSSRVHRGGNWIADAFSCRVALRASSAPTSSNNYTGFRVARSSVP
ncbi:MAG: hypothetical protein EAZ42_04145 [Verrucomicrobia bacterium]|nr:MAG: hypothetical protein EAZ42_04145 [Verrucomicrobiota bacterium]